MALVKCSECNAEISSLAAACVGCGAPLAPVSINAMPVVVRQEPSFKWWLWLPLGIVALFLAIGASIPKNTADANAFARACRDMYAKGQVASMSECDSVESRIRYGGDASQSPPANTSFVAEPPQPPSSLSNAEITRRVLYPELYKDKKQPAKR